MSVREFNTWNPALHFEVLRGAFLGQELRRRTLSFTYTDRARKFDEIEWELDNRDGYCTRSENIAAGLILRMRLGYLGAMILPQSFIINKLTGGVGVAGQAAPAIGLAEGRIRYSGRNRNAPGNLKGKNRIKKGKYAGPTRSVTQFDMFLNKEKSGTKIFHVRSVADAVREIARRHGFSGPYALVQDTPDRVENVVIPSGKSDGEFLQEQAQRFGYSFKIDHRGLHWHADDWGRVAASKPVDKLIYGVSGDILPGGLRIIGDFKLPLPIKVEVRGRDHQVRRGFVADKDAGKAGLTRAFTSFYAIMPPGAPNSQEKIESLTRIERMITPESVEVASLEATNRFVKRHLAALKLEVTTVGNPKLLATYRVLIAGTYSRLVDGIWRIDEARHMFSGGTYQTKITLKRPAPPSKAVAAPSDVTRFYFKDKKAAASGVTAMQSHGYLVKSDDMK